MMMASLSTTPVTFSSSYSPPLLLSHSHPISLPSLSYTRAGASFKPISHLPRTLTVRSLTLDFSGSFFERGDGDDEEDNADVFGGDPLSTFGDDIEDAEEPQCPPGLRKYETMAVLRPDVTEEERLKLTQKYEELLVAGGGMYVEVFNRGVIPLAYNIKKKNKEGETTTYMDGLYLLFTYFTKPETMAVIQPRLNTDDDIIRSSSFQIRKRKYN